MSSSIEHNLTALLTTKERFELALAGANDGLWDWNLITNKVYFSPRWKSMLGYEDHEIEAELIEWSDRVHPEDLQDALAAVASYLEGRSERYSIEVRMRHKNGHFVDILSRGQLVNDEQGKAIRFLGTHVDISERKNAETKFRTLFESSQDAIMLLNEDGFIDCNKAALSIFGVSTRAEFCRCHPVDLSPAQQPNGKPSLTEANERIQTALSRGREFFEWVHCRRDGQQFIADVLLTRMELNGGHVLQATVRDITARKHTEQLLQQQNEELRKTNERLKETQVQLLQSEKMASVGQLAAGVAHEINNPIGYVTSNIATLTNYLTDIFSLIDAYEGVAASAPNSPAVEQMKTLKSKIDFEHLRKDLTDLILESEEGLSRVRSIVKDLKDFSRAGESTWEVTHLHSGLDSTLNIVYNELKYKAGVVKEYGEIPNIECIPSQLNQVFMNLFVNAVHAIEDRGVVHIKTSLEGEDAICVEVSDTGKGIPQNILSRIFEPFFTTKDVGQGTGLGLSVAYGIIERHKGKIDVTSQVGVGTTFRIVLPVKHPR